MAAAYAFAEGDGPAPPEIRIGRAVDKFGANAVFGRRVSAKEIQEISLAETVMSMYRERARAKNPAEWAQENAQGADLLGLALRAALDLGLIDGE